MIRAYWGFRTALAWTLAFVSFLAFAVTDTNYLNPGNIYALIQTFAVLWWVSSPPCSPRWRWAWSTAG